MKGELRGIPVFDLASAIIVEMNFLAGKYHAVVWGVGRTGQAPGWRVLRRSEYERTAYSYAHKDSWRTVGIYDRTTIMASDIDEDLEAWMLEHGKQRGR